MRIDCPFRQKTSTGCNSKSHNHLLTTDSLTKALSTHIIKNAGYIRAYLKSSTAAYHEEKACILFGKSLVYVYIVQRKVTVMNGASTELPQSSSNVPYGHM